ncbi:MAG: ATP synthase subunit alpha [candidate division TM6 bacterium GW2011_GWF2_32_72]|nr:MAG: ATP synthase subunit alpha [candidate division TM6 bacterium GW2011_GWF2_32_72]
MDIKSTDLISLFEKSLSDQPQKKLDEIGIVVQISDNICKVHGLSNAVYSEIVDFEGGNKGVILDLDEDFVSVFLLYRNIEVNELEVAKRTGTVFKTIVGDELLGRTINALGKPIDALGPIKYKEKRPIQVTVPGVTERSPVNTPLETGILAIDALIPIGKGQRELIIGNRNTGKTAIVVDTILNQKGKDVICIYVSIGQRQAGLARIIKTLEEHGALEYSVIISADASEAVINQYLAPYVGTTIAEYFRDTKKDVLIIYDDLTNHAVAYREMSLLMMRAPGREAFPGDVFYLHSRLLERAGKLAAGGSITALPIAQVQSDDITAYIPTNLISITDGQIFLDTKLFNSGIRPAINIELSVSRVGGAAQTSAVKNMSKALKLELAQYRDLLDFAQFGSELDEVSQRVLAKGSIAVEILKQNQFINYSFIDEALILFAYKENYLDKIPLKEISKFLRRYVNYVKSVYPEIWTTIQTTTEISPETKKQLAIVTQEFEHLFSSE